MNTITAVRNSSAPLPLADPRSTAQHRKLSVPPKPPEPTRLTPGGYNAEPMFDSRRAAVILGKPAETLKKWRQRGRGPEFVRYHDGTVRYRLTALTKYIEQCTIKPARP